MFSLIITIVSIALVAALALATLYYGGSAFNQGTADAEAARIMNQGQQLMGAADLYYADKNEWPASPQVLEAEGYLKKVPVAAASMDSAYAQTANDWVMPEAGKPVFKLAPRATDVCRSVNKLSYGLDGILPQALTSLASQCYGETMGEHVVVFAKSGAYLADAMPPAEVGTGDIPPTEDPSWVVKPGTKPPATGGGNPGGGNPPPSGDDETVNGALRFNTSACYYSSSTDDAGQMLYAVTCPDNLTIARADNGAFTSPLYDTTYDKGTPEDTVAWSVQLSNLGYYHEWYNVRVNSARTLMDMETLYKDLAMPVALFYNASVPSSVQFVNRGNFGGTTYEEGSLPVQPFATNVLMTQGGPGASAPTDSANSTSDSFTANVNSPMTFTLTGNGLTSNTKLEFMCHYAGNGAEYLGGYNNYAEPAAFGSRWTEVPGGVHSFNGGALTVSNVVFPDMGNGNPCLGSRYSVMFRVRDGAKTGVINKTAYFWGF